MWEPDSFDPAPDMPENGPPLPFWAVEEAAPAGPEPAAAPEHPAVAPLALAVEAPPEPEPPALQPRTLLRRLSELALAPIQIARPKPPAAEPKPPGAETRQPEPPAAKPNLMDRIRLARTKAAVTAQAKLDSPPAPTPAPAPALDPLQDDDPEAPAGWLTALAGPVPDLPRVPDLPSVPELPSMESAPEATLAPPPLVEEPAPPPPLFTAESPAPRPPDAQGPRRHLESLFAAIDAEMAAADSTAAPLPAPRASRDARQAAEAGRYVVFHMGDTRYGLPISDVIEMGVVPKTTPLPNVPDFVRGVANLRGEILAVLDLRTLLGLAPAADAFRERLLVVRPAGSEMTAGLVVDSVRGLARLGEDGLQPPTAPLDDRVADFLGGVATYEDRVLNVLDPGKLFSSAAVSALSVH